MSYNFLEPFKFITGGSMGATYTSRAIEVKEQDNIAIQLHWTGNPVGSFEFQCSTDYKEDMNGNITNVGNWVTLDNEPPVTSAGMGDDAYIDFNQISTSYMRVVFTRISGTGVLTGYISGKGV